MFHAIGFPRLLTLCFVLAVSATASAAREKSAADLIRDLTYQSDRPKPPGMLSGVLTCGTLMGRVEEDRALASSLVKLGSSAVPDLEQALDSMEGLGPGPQIAYGGTWLLYAYAAIAGPAAYPRLRRMTRNPELQATRFVLDQSVAISFGLTSYVDGYRQSYEALGSGPACFVKEPRDALDDAILTWVKNDQAGFQESLGSNAKGDLEKLLKGRTWAQMRAELWPRSAGPEVGLGYRLKIPGRWSEPWESLKRSTTDDRDISRDPKDPEIDTDFTNRSGSACGARRVKFKTGVDIGSLPRYFVDNSDLADLLRLISSCATQVGPHHRR